MRHRVVYRGWSPLAGRIRVIEDRGIRRLLVAGETLSMMPTNGDWAPVRREYWWHAVSRAEIVPRPSVLLVGLGGGTQVHLLRQAARPRSFTIVERDEAVLRVALDWFGLRQVPRMEFVCADAAVAVPELARTGRRFDYVMEDAAYGLEVAGAIDLARALANVVSARGTLVLNRHWRRDARRVRDTLAPFFGAIRMHRVKREGENVLIVCSQPVRANVSPRAADPVSRSCSQRPSRRAASSAGVEQSRSAPASRSSASEP